MTAKIVYTTGDATEPSSGSALIAHICNDRGGWGAGFVLALSKRWPKVELAYREWYNGRGTEPFVLGQVQVVEAESGVWVANMIAQEGYYSKDKPPIRYEALRQCLDLVAKYALTLGATVHMPRIGTGLAGGSWDMIEPLIESTIIEAGVDTTVYDLKQGYLRG